VLTGFHNRAFRCSLWGKNWSFINMYIYIDVHSAAPEITWWQYSYAKARNQGVQNVCVCVWKSTDDSKMSNSQSTLSTELNTPITTCLLSLEIYGRNSFFKIAAPAKQVPSCLPTFQSEYRPTICKWLSPCLTCKTSSKNNATSDHSLFQNNINKYVRSNIRHGEAQNTERNGLYSDWDVVTSSIIIRW
jgi:hypothetical protein